MNDLARRIQRVYLTLLLGNTLAASFIWGINTLFLLDAGLIEPRGVRGERVLHRRDGALRGADGRRRRHRAAAGPRTSSERSRSRPRRSSTTSCGSSSAPFWQWAIVSMLLGLGFTFFSGAVEAWLVDALNYAGLRGRPRGRARARADGLRRRDARRVGRRRCDRAGDDPRRAVPAAGRRAARDVRRRLARSCETSASRPTGRRGPVKAVKHVFSASLDHGLGNPPVRWMMLAAPFTSGVGFYTFYALQPYLLELWGDSEAYSIAGLAAAIVAGAQIAGGYAAPRIRATLPQANDARSFSRRSRAAASSSLLGVTSFFWIGARAARRLGAALRRRDADPAGVPERHDPVAAARDRALVRLAHGQHGRRRRPAGARAGGRRVQLLDVTGRSAGWSSCSRCRSCS